MSPALKGTRSSPPSPPAWLPRLARTTTAHPGQPGRRGGGGPWAPSPSSRDELLAGHQRRGRALEQAAKVLDRATRASARARVQAWQAAGERVVFTNGCFDLLHVGHVTYLERASAEARQLVVGAQHRPLGARPQGPPAPPHLTGRPRVLAALAAVDAVVLFDEETPLELILTLRPDVLAKGADYTEATVVGSPRGQVLGRPGSPHPPGRGPQHATGIINDLGQPGGILDRPTWYGSPASWLAGPDPHSGP